MAKRLERGKRAVPVRAAPPPAAAHRRAQRHRGARPQSKTLGRGGSTRSSSPSSRRSLNALSPTTSASATAPCVLVFEGNDAAGKGGAIRRVTRALDARHLRRRPHRRARPRRSARSRTCGASGATLPRRGRFTLFDRSWYGRVLVERVEGFAAEPDWMRAYREIVDFEDSLVRSGIVVVKLWLAVSQGGAAEALPARARRPPSSASRSPPRTGATAKKWDAYQRAVCDMVDRTSTEPAARGTWSRRTTRSGRA